MHLSHCGSAPVPGPPELHTRVQRGRCSAAERCELFSRMAAVIDNDRPHSGAVPWSLTRPIAPRAEPSSPRRAGQQSEPGAAPVAHGQKASLSKSSWPGGAPLAGVLFAAAAGILGSSGLARKVALLALLWSPGTGAVVTGGYTLPADP